jgi:hypothetical protein
MSEPDILIGSVKGAIVGFILGLKASFVLALLIRAFGPSTDKGGSLAIGLCWLFAAAGVGSIVGGLLARTRRESRSP